MVPHRAGHPVNTFWDIGNSDGTGIWLHQRIGQADNFIGYIECWGEPYSYYTNELSKYDYSWGTHYLPHDAKHVRQGAISNISPKDSLIKLGLRNVEVVPVVDQLSHGIQATRDSFSSCYFDETACKDGIIHLESYRKRWNKTTGRFSDQPLKDVHTECADAFRMFGQSHMADRLDKKTAKVTTKFNSVW